jgi:hypothetical protein
MGGFRNPVSQGPDFRKRFPENRFFESRFLKGGFQIADFRSVILHG